MAELICSAGFFLCFYDFVQELELKSLGVFLTFGDACHLDWILSMWWIYSDSICSSSARGILQWCFTAL